MFPYSDPTGTDVLAEQEALSTYQIVLDRGYAGAAEQADSAFTRLEAIHWLPEGIRDRATVPWAAFPRNVTADNDRIDRDRFRLQEEYVEWQVERDGAGRVERVTFTTLFPEWFMALAAQGLDSVAAGIREFYPDAEPTAAEVFGEDFDAEGATPVERFFRFQARMRQNPWNDGTRGILSLSHPVNTLGALAKLLADCGVEQPNVPSTAVCQLVFSVGACVPGRNSDPNVCVAAQELVRARRSFTLADPAGIEILSIGGAWSLGGQQISLADPDSNEGLWRITHGGHRAVLEVPPELTQGSAPVRSGAQVAAVVQVGSTVLHAADADLPEWARTGREELRAPGE